MVVHASHSELLWSHLEGPVGWTLEAMRIILLILTLSLCGCAVGHEFADWVAHQDIKWTDYERSRKGLK